MEESKVNLMEALLNNDTREVSNDNKISVSRENGINEIVEKIINEFTTNKADLINDSENGNIPESAVKDDVMNYLTRRYGTNDGTNKLSLGKDTIDSILKKVKDYLWGYYVLQDLIDDESISDIKVLAYDNIEIKVYGKRKKSNVKFPSKKSYDIFANYVIVKHGGALDQGNALQTLSDKTSDKFNLRIEVSLPIINSVNNTYLTIRKIPKEKPMPEDLRDKAKMFNENIYKYMKKVTEAGLNMIVCGKGGSGKTTFLNAWLEALPKDVACEVIQESEELHSKHPNMMFKKVKVKNGNDDVGYSLQVITKHAMIEDLDMIVIGEIKGAEAMDLFQAVYTGHCGWGTVHANKASEAPEKLVLYMGYSNTNLNRKELLKMLSSLDVIVFMKDYKVMEVTEIAGFDEEKEDINYNPIFKWEKGEFKKIGNTCEKVQEKFDYVEYKKERDKS